MCEGMDRETLCTFCHQAFNDGVIMGEGEYRWSEETIHIRHISDRKEGKCRHYVFGCFFFEFPSQVVVTIFAGHYYLF